MREMCVSDESSSNDNSDDDSDHSFDAADGFEAAHLGVRCDGCDMSPIRGTRYKCTTRYDFDLCGRCREQDDSGNEFIEIRRPITVRLDAKFGEIVRERVHNGIGCDGCGMLPLRGTRIKCTTRNDFDLCQKCRNKDSNSGNEYFEIS